MWKKEPARIRILAILHLVFAGLGLMAGVGAVVSTIFARAILANEFAKIGSKAGSPPVSLDPVQTDATTWYECSVTVILAVLLTVAGVKLLKRRRSGLLWSNAYALTAIVARLASLVRFLVVEMPKIDHPTPSPTLGPVSGISESLLSSIFSIGMPLLCCIYPILVMSLLNRRQVKDFLT